jgi:hypothetical protein
MSLLVSNINKKKAAGEACVLHNKRVKKFCIMTYVHNEPFHFPNWMKWYSSIFYAKDIFVINNNSNDGSFEEVQASYSFNTIKFDTKHNHDFISMQSFLYDQLAEKLKSYAGVFVAECDEILYHPDGLLKAASFYMSLPTEAVRSSGYEPVHDYFGGEPDLDESKPWLAQRAMWQDVYYMRKPVFIKKPIKYFDLMHDYDGKISLSDNRLALIHMKMIDYKKMLERNWKTMAEGNFKPEIHKEKFGWQNRISDQSDFDIYFKDNLARCTPIPKRFKNVI